MQDMNWWAEDVWNNVPELLRIRIWIISHVCNKVYIADSIGGEFHSHLKVAWPIILRQMEAHPISIFKSMLKGLHDDVRHKWIEW